MPRLTNIYRLGVKELRSLSRDPVMLILIVYTFTVSIYVAATNLPETLHNTPLAIVDEDASPLSVKIASAFYPPRFRAPQMISLSAIDEGMDAGRDTFVLDIPPNFQRDVLDSKSPALQLNVDATRMTQAFTGSTYVQQMVTDEINDFVQRYRGSAAPPVALATRALFNPNLDQTWFGSTMEIVNNVTILSIISTVGRPGSGKRRVQRSCVLALCGFLVFRGLLEAEFQRERDASGERSFGNVSPENKRIHKRIIYPFAVTLRFHP